MRLLSLFLFSCVMWGRLTGNIHILVLTTNEFRTKLEAMFPTHLLHIDYMTMDVRNIFGAGSARLFIYQYPKINKYQKILYLDLDALVIAPLDRIFNKRLPAHLYAKREGSITEGPWGMGLFTEVQLAQTTDKSAFNTGVLLFNRGGAASTIFKNTLEQIQRYIHTPREIAYPPCLEQPFLVHTAKMMRSIDTDTLDGDVAFNLTEWGSNYTISHFLGGPGDSVSKWDKMTRYIRAWRPGPPVPFTTPWKGKWNQSNGKRVMVEFRGDGLHVGNERLNCMVDANDCIAMDNYIGRFLRGRTSFILLNRETLELTSGGGAPLRRG